MLELSLSSMHKFGEVRCLTLHAGTGYLPRIHVVVARGLVEKHRISLLPPSLLVRPLNAQKGTHLHHEVQARGHYQGELPNQTPQADLE